MDLKSGYPYWAVKNGLMQAFPSLQENLRCDVAVIGGGITGALVAHELATQGYGVVVLEGRDIGWGSTSASTALLQYEIDTHLVDLAKKYGEALAVLAYQACADSIPLLHALSREVRDVDFGRMRSLYYASRRRHARSLLEEYELRMKHGFDVQWLSSGEIRSDYGFHAPAAILSKLAARIDPYRMTYRLLARLCRLGCAVHDRSVVDDLHSTSRTVTLRTATGFEVRADYAIIAAGYESQRWLHDRVAANRSSYAFITDPIEADRLGPLADTMMWESARPYIYLRTTGDKRLLVGGEDDRIDIPTRRDARVKKKSKQLVKKVASIFPKLPLQPAFSWAGTFAETKDGLPFFGPHPQHGPRVLFAMAYGGNGISYSVIGAGLLRSLIERRRHSLSDLFGFGRHL